jgi:hypothetical protein
MCNPTDDFNSLCVHTCVKGVSVSKRLSSIVGNAIAILVLIRELV